MLGPIYGCTSIASERVNELEELKRERHRISLLLDGFIQNLAACENVLENFDERIWAAAIDKVVVSRMRNWLFGPTMAQKLCGENATTLDHRNFYESKVGVKVTQH